MIHHDSRPYPVAVSEAAEHLRKKLEGLIKTSVSRVERVIEQVENDVPEDAIVVGNSMAFKATESGIALIPPRVYKDYRTLDLHRNAVDQVADRTGIRNFRTVAKELIAEGDWGRELVAKNLTEIYRHGANDDRYLLRAVRGQLRGFLSDKFRRLDSKPLLDAFVGAIQQFGARPIDGFALDTKISIRAVLPMVFEPCPGEVLAFGIELKDSDFGDGALEIVGFVLRVWCTNTCTTEDVLRRAHLGKRLSEDMTFSKETLALDTRTMASAVADVTGHVLNPKAVNGYLDMVKEANEAKISTNEITSWVKKNLNKGEADQVVAKFVSPEIEMLPKGQTRWRFSNALSWLANEVEDEGRKLELQAHAGAVLRPKKEVATAAAASA